MILPQQWMCIEFPSLGRDQVQCLHWHTKPVRIDPDLQNVMSCAQGKIFSQAKWKRWKWIVRLQLNIWCSCKRYAFNQLWMVYPGFLCQQPPVQFAGRRRCSRLCCSLGGWESQAQQGHGWQQWGRDRGVLARDQWSIGHHMSLQTLKAKDSAKLNALITIWWGNSQDTLFGERAGPSEGDISKNCSGQS